MTENRASARAIFLCGAACGVAIAGILFARFLLTDPVIGSLELLLWPSQIVLMAAQQGFSSPGNVVLLLISLTANGILYGIGALALVAMIRIGRSSS